MRTGILLNLFLPNIRPHSSWWLNHCSGGNLALCQWGKFHSECPLPILFLIERDVLSIQLGNVFSKYLWSSKLNLIGLREELFLMKMTTGDHISVGIRESKSQASSEQERQRAWDQLALFRVRACAFSSLSRFCALLSVSFSFSFSLTERIPRFHRIPAIMLWISLGGVAYN